MSGSLHDERFLPLKDAAALVAPYRTESALKLALQQGRIASDGAPVEGKRRGRWLVDSQSALFLQWCERARRMREDEQERREDADEITRLRETVSQLRARLDEADIELRVMRRQVEDAERDRMGRFELACRYHELRAAYERLVAQVGERLDDAGTARMRRGVRPTTVRSSNRRR